MPNLTPEYEAERTRNPFVRSTGGGRVLSALQLPWFMLLPPAGYGVLTMTGRRTGKTRRKCIRVIRRGDRGYVVSIPGAHAAWLKNVRANPNVRLRVRGGTVTGVVRELGDPEERRQAMAAYCETVTPVDYLACSMHRRGRPSRAKVKELLRTWFDQGIPLVVELVE